MKRTLTLAFALTLAAVGTATAANVIDDFESYAVGSNLAGQNSWKGWDNVSGAGALVSSAHAYSGNNSVNITGASDLVHTYSGMTSGIWTYSIRQYIPSTSAGNSYLILLNQYNDGGPYNWSVQIQNNMTTGQIISDIGGTTNNIMVKDAWVEYRFDINLGANTVSEFYNGTLLSTHAWQDGTGQNAIGGMDLFANSAGPVYYDNLSVTLVPEPASVSLLALGGLAFLLRRRSA